MGWPARAVIIQKPVNRDQGPLPQEVLQGASLEHILGGLKLHWRAWQKCGVAARSLLTARACWTMDSPTEDAMASECEWGRRTESQKTQTFTLPPPPHLYTVAPLPTHHGV